ncbi:MAG: GNAT family N-acetyltransferase [bacterium]
MSIEVARGDEIGIVLTLIEELLVELGEEGREFSGIDREKLRRDIQRNIGTEPGPPSGTARFWALLAKDEGGTVLGVLTLSRSFALYAGGEYGVIDEMYVRPEHRCRGIGRELVDGAVAMARQQGWFRLDVAAPQDRRGERAARFYEKLGFEFTGPKLRLLVGCGVD